MRSRSAKTRTARGTYLESNFVGLGHGVHGGAGLHDEVGGIDGLNVEGDLARLDSLDIENVVDEADEALGVFQRDVEHAVCLVRVFPQNAAGQQAERSSNRGERSAKFVADDGDELILHAIDFATLGDILEDGVAILDAGCGRSGNRCCLRR